MFNIASLTASYLVMFRILFTTSHLVMFSTASLVATYLVMFRIISSPRAAT
jgi:hypothetical protein